MIMNLERGVKVYYELYIDSLFLINFVMNLYLLELVNRTFLRTATRRRVVLGAALGAALYLVPFFLGGPAWLRTALGFGAAAAGMIGVTFRVRSFKTFCRIAERLFLYSFLFGGILLFLLRLLPGLRRYLVNVFGLLGMGALVYAEVSRILDRRGKSQNLCRVVLVGKGARITVEALIDTGNGLVEPISGKPVSILERSVFEGLWMDGKPAGYRVIPYHSIGRKKGILQGFPIPEIQLEVDGVVKVCYEVYVGVTDEKLSGEGNYRMIIPSSLLECKAERTASGL